MAGTGTAHLRAPEETLVQAREVVVEYGSRSARISAVAGISLDVAKGETLGVVGESGCGKSTLAHALLMLPPPTSGTVLFDGEDLGGLDQGELREMRSRMQLIFQNPIASLNPRRTAHNIVAEGLKLRGVPSAQVHEKVAQALADVGLDDAKQGHRRPHEFSGGQCQRISIARSLVLDPELLICDEPVSALDVSVQAQILNLLKDMKSRYGLTLVFIAHDLAVVKNVSDFIAVMYLGKLCEVGPSEAVYRSPLHPYTRGLLNSVPTLESDEETRPIAIKGEPASPLRPPSGCRFRTRCPLAAERCAEEEPVVREVTPGQFVACHFAEAAA